MPNGADFSNNQGAINWPAVAADVDFVWIKATEGGTYTDPLFARNLQGARAAGIPVGAYHYARPDNNSPETEAGHFLDTYKARPGDLLPVLDFETHAPGKSAAYMTSWAERWMELVHQGLNAEVILYTYPYFISGDMGGAAALKGTKLWYADYSGKPWRFNYKDKAANFNIVAQQYSSTGHVGGVKGYVDLNYAPELTPISQSRPKPKPNPNPRKRLPGPQKKPAWFWLALKQFIQNRQKNV